MQDLIKKHRPYVENIKSMLRNFNDSKDNPLFNDGRTYEKCEIANTSPNKSDSLVDKMNVLILIFDSTSFNHFQRIFPLTFKYLKNLTNNIIFKNYNVVGENSFPNMLPFFTGLHTENNTDLNLTDERANIFKFEKEKFEDFQPFIWKDYEKENYVTMYSEDLNSLGLFNYLSPGMQYKDESQYCKVFWLYILDN